MAELSTKGRDKLKKSDFAEPEKRAYPIEDKPHAKQRQSPARPRR